MHFDVMNLMTAHIKISIGLCQMWQACLLAMGSVSFCVFMCITIDIVKEEGITEVLHYSLFLYFSRMMMMQLKRHQRSTLLK